MLEIQKENRDAIVQYLSNLIVPVQVGVDISKIISVLQGLKEIEVPKAEDNK